MTFDEWQNLPIDQQFNDPEIYRDWLNNPHFNVTWFAESAWRAATIAANIKHQKEIERLKAELEKERALTTKYQKTFAKLYNVAPENPSPEIEETFKKHFKDILAQDSAKRRG